MDWLQLASIYTPPHPDALTLYDQLRLWADQHRAYVIFAYLVAVYYLGFATRFWMPVLKMVLLYVVLFAGAIVFSILDTTLPVKSALFVAVALLVVVKLRMKRPRQP